MKTTKLAVMILLIIAATMSAPAWAQSPGGTPGSLNGGKPTVAPGAVIAPPTAPTAGNLGGAKPAAPPTPTVSAPGAGFQTKVDGQRVQVQNPPATSVASPPAITPPGKSPYLGVGKFDPKYRDTFQRGVNGRKETETHVANGDKPVVIVVHGTTPTVRTGTLPPHRSNPGPVAAAPAYTAAPAPAAPVAGLTAADVDARIAAASDKLIAALKKGDEVTAAAAHKELLELKNELDKAIAGERNDRKVAVNALSRKLEAETADREADDKALSDKLDAETTARETAINELRNELKKAGDAGDGKLANRIEELLALYTALDARMKQLEVATKISASPAPSSDKAAENAARRATQKRVMTYLAGGLALLMICMVGGLVFATILTPKKGGAIA